jgi:hypothetical protein
MKYGILTFHRALNYGAVLQAWALQRKISMNGCSCAVLDYNSKQMKSYTAAINMFEKPKTLKSYISAIYKSPFRLVRKIRFSNFVKKYLHITSTLNSQRLKGCYGNYDGVIVGSDQVWNDYLTGFDKAYFLDFIEGKKKISYAASFGFAQIPNNLKNDYRNLLDSFTAISVREKTGAEIIEELLDRKADICIDPTLLLDDKDWMYFIKKQKREKYILIYSINKNINLFECAIRLSQEKNLKLYYICNDMCDIHKLSGIKNVKHLLSPNPVEFLNLIYHAEYIFTNSFHGTVFSIIFQKEFYCETNYGEHQNHRINELIENLSIKDHIICSDKINETTINWLEVEKKLKNDREKSEQYLIDVLEL